MKKNSNAVRGRWLFKRVWPLLFLVSFCHPACGQKLSVATNLLDYINLGTINGEIGLGVSKKIMVYLRGKYNPFVFRQDQQERQFQNKQVSIAAGAKCWWWRLYSGWFVSGHFGFSRYNTGGIVSPDTWEGEAYAVTVGAGYTWMIHRHLNIDFGVGLAGGITRYTKYACPTCGKILKAGHRFYAAPDNLLVQLSYLF